MTVLRLSEADVAGLLPGVDLVATAREVFLAHANQRTVLPAEAALRWENEHGDACRSLNMPGLVEIWGERVAGTKIINASVGNPDRNLPRASGSVLLFDMTTARLKAILDAAHISSGRTAAVSILAAEMLWAAPVARIGVIGAGAQAQRHLELAARRWPHLRTVQVHDALPERAQDLVQRLGTTFPDIAFQHAATGEAAVRDAQLLVTATTTTTGYIPADWIAEGAVVVNVSLDDLLPSVYESADKVIVDDWHLVADDTTRLLGRLYRAGEAAAPARYRDDYPVTGQAPAVTVDAELADLIARTHPGREHAKERIVVNPFGMSLHDIAVAAAVLRAAEQSGIGERLAP